MRQIQTTTRRRGKRYFSWWLIPALILGNAIPGTTVYGQDLPDIELVNFAFSNYLGSGFYASDGGEVYILNIPLSTTLKPMTDDEAGWVVKYPISLGVANIDAIIGGDLPDLDDVGTVSVIPGIEYHYPALSNWQLIPFFDLGIARDVVNDVNIGVLGTGVKSFVTFDFGANWLTLGNRFLYAAQEAFETGSYSNFAVFETGLDYNIPTRLSIDGSIINVSFYYLNTYYLKDLVLVDFLDARISLENKNEIGFTFSLPEHAWLPDDSRIGLGVQITRDDELYRLVFGAPFF